ncbi:MAG: hypothetical protein RLO50_02160 [Azospirillaceae bacterium]
MNAILHAFGALFHGLGGADGANPSDPFAIGPWDIASTSGDNPGDDPGHVKAAATLAAGAGRPVEHRRLPR